MSEKDGVRSLHLGSNTVQSAMRVSDPFELVLSYTRAMMGFLLFAPEPSHVAMIGLGGGSLAKFVRHHMPETRITVVESNPRVISVARSYFEVPDDDQQFLIVPGQGEHWIEADARDVNVLMVDGYDGRSQAGALSTEDFYTRARQALAPDGVLVVNLWSSDRKYDVYLQRIERCFDFVVTLPAVRRGNVAVLAFSCKPRELRWMKLKPKARDLGSRYGLDFVAMVDAIRESNPCSDKELRF